MPSRTALLLALALVTTGLAGCIGTTNDPLEANQTITEDPVDDYVPVDTDALSKPVHDILPRVTDRIQVSVGGIDLFVEYWLPDGEGPWPTVVHSTPYSHLDRSLYATEPVTGITGYKEFFVPRGYAYVVVDVRGFGESEGCVEVWGPGEQQDQADLVNWVADQSWSDGNVGMIGVSYPGTTPMEAAVMAPEPLKAIVAVAGLTDPYYDWHFGGVPNGESGPTGSPAAYQGIGAVVPLEVTHGQDWAEAAADGGCQTPQLAMDAYQSDGTYTDFYAERNLSARVDQVEAAVLYTQGFQDGNVKPAQLLNWFNALDVPKKGIFGHWGHQNPPREDWNDLTLAWFDQHLKGIETRVMEGPPVEVHTNLDTWRADVAFPSNQTQTKQLFLDAPDGMAWEAPDEGQVAMEVGRVQATADDVHWFAGTGDEEELVLRTEPLEQDLYLSGQGKLQLKVTLEGQDNALVWADLYQVKGEDREEVTFGALNLALRNDVTEYEPVPQGELVRAFLRFQPVEEVVQAGHALELVLRPVDHGMSPTTEASLPATLTIHTGEEGSRLLLPVLDGRPDEPRPDEV